MASKWLGSHAPLKQMALGGFPVHFPDRPRIQTGCLPLVRRALRHPRQVLAVGHGDLVPRGTTRNQVSVSNSKDLAWMSQRTPDQR